MERTSRMIAWLTLTPLAIGLSAQGGPISFTNGSFENTIGYAGNTTDPGSPSAGLLVSSANITGPGTSGTIPGWNTTTDGIGCVDVGNATDVCGSRRAAFAGSAFWSYPGAVPGGGNYVLVDGDPTVTTTLYQYVTGLTVGQQYTVNFWQAAAQKTDETGHTTEQWLVSFDTCYNQSDCTSSVPYNYGDAFTVCDPSVAANNSTCESQASALMNNASKGSVAWNSVSMIFTAQSANEYLAFFAVGTPTGQPPIVLLGDISVTATPEPAAYILIGFGLLGLSVVHRQLRKRG